MRLGPPGISERGKIFPIFLYSVRVDMPERFRGLCLVAVGLTQCLLDEIFLALFDVSDGFWPDFLAMPSGVFCKFIGRSLRVMYSPSETITALSTTLLSSRMFPATDNLGRALAETAAF